MELIGFWIVQFIWLVYFLYAIKDRQDKILEELREINQSNKATFQILQAAWTYKTYTRR